jgi:uracil-DNA glycosylase family 4
VTFRQDNQSHYPDFHNAPVPSFGGRDAQLLIVGLAPGLKGANQTGRPFTGDYAGDLLYETLRKHEFAQGEYGRRPDDGLALVGCRITNAVRCVPPENKPTGREIATCRRFLEAEIESLPNLRAVLALGAVAHGAVLAALGLTRSHFPFRHGVIHDLPAPVWLADSYHCSRYNTNTRRLTVEMFDAVFAALRARLSEVAA